MSNDEKKITRRGLLSLAWVDRPIPAKPSPRPASRADEGATPAPSNFSLTAFYEQRDESGTAASPLPVFRMREGLETVPTTRIGTPELGPAAQHRGPIAPESDDAGRARLAPVGAGHLRLNRDRCLAWQKSFCTVCSEHCPEPGAITVDLGRPSIVDELCTRCGVCIAVCPAPINAFELEAAVDEAPKGLA